MNRRPWSRAIIDGDMDLVDPVELYKRFLSPRECDRIESITYELRQVAVRRPQHLELAIKAHRTGALKRMPSARRRPEQFDLMYQIIANDARKYGDLHHQITELTKHPGTSCASYRYATSPDGTLYDIRGPKTTITPIDFIDAHLYPLPGNSKTAGSVEHRIRDRRTAPFRSVDELTERMLGETRIIVVSYRPPQRTAWQSVLAEGQDEAALAPDPSALNKYRESVIRYLLQLKDTSRERSRQSNPRKRQRPS